MNKPHISFFIILFGISLTLFVDLTSMPEIVQNPAIDLAVPTQVPIIQLEGQNSSAQPEVKSPDQNSTSSVEMGIGPNLASNQEQSQLPQSQISVVPEELSPKLKGGSEEKDEKNIYLNFDNADLSSFINYIAEVKKLNLISDKTIESAKISLSIRDPLTPEGAWGTFLTVLEMAGFSIIKVEDVYKVIPKDQKGQQPLPVYINVLPDTLPKDDSNLRYVLFLTNLNVGDYKELLQNMLSDKSTVVDVKEVNAFIITDKSLNIISASKLLLDLDQMGGAESATFIRLNNANATDVKNLLETLMKKPEVSPLARLLGKTAEGSRDYFPPGTKIVADERLNALILIGDPTPIKKIQDFIVTYIDTELKEARSPLHVFELQYTDATQIAEILKEVTMPPESPTGQAATKYGAIRGGVKYFRSMNFKVDKDGNRLIVSSTDDVDWKLLKATIKDLDKPQPQVAIETLIITVDIDDEKELSGAIRNKKHGMIGKNIDFQSAALVSEPSLERSQSGDPVSLLGNMISQITSRQGLAAVTIGSAINSNIWSIFQALKTQTNTSIISQPFMTVSNKTRASVKVGTEQRILQEQTADGLKGYEAVNADTEVIVTPQINLEGLIRLEIETNINEFLNVEATSKVTRNLKTSVSVSDGQVLVLGGFVKTKVGETTYKTPLLGDIPILGWLFKSRHRSISKQYIFIFMSPTIIKPRLLPGMNLYTKMKLHEATDSIEDGVTTKRTPDPIYNWFFNPEKENYSHKVIDFANARYQPTTVDIKNDPYYRTQTQRQFEMNPLNNDSVDQNSDKKVSPQYASQQNTTMSSSKQSSDISVTAQVNESKAKDIEQPQQQTVVGSMSIPEFKSNINLSDEGVKTSQKNLITCNDPNTDRNQKRELLKDTISSSTDLDPIVQQGIVEAAPIESFNDRLDTEEKKHKKRRIHKEKKRDRKEIAVNIKKRNRLKEFLSKNPALSKNQEIKSSLVGKEMA